MKKLSVYIFLLLVSASAFSQTLRPNPMPLFAQQGNSTTWYQPNGITYTRVGLAPALYTDTTDANTNSYIKLVPLSLIATSSDGKWWRRNLAADKWEEVSVGGSVTTIYTGDGTLNGDRSIDGGGYNFSITNTLTNTILSNNGSISNGFISNGDNARIEGFNSATSRSSDVFAHADSVAIWPSKGVVSIDTLAAWAGGDTTSHKPTTWNIHTKRFEVSPSWFGGNGGSVTTLSGNARYAIKFNGIDGSNVWLGQFYPVADSLYQCYYEWWVRVDSSGYIWSDGYGGSHDLLFGFVGNDTACSITGNMFYAFTGQSFGSWDLMKRGTVHHVAVSFTGTYIIVWIDGVPTQRSARTLPRLNVASSGCGGGYFGGSDHQNADCNVFQMRAYEFGLPFYIGDGDCFHPNQSFTPANNNVVLCINVDKTNNLLVNDLSTGFWGIKHDGFRNYNVGGDPAYPPSQTNYLNYPEIVVDSIVQATYTGSTSSSAAKIYDYFERADQVPAFQVAPSLDSTQGGSLGKKKWEDGTYANSATLFAGIINKYAYFSATTLQNYKKVLGNSNTQDVRVTFANTTTEVNVDVLARVQDDNNKILGRVSNGGQTLTLYSWIGGVFTTIGSYTGTAISEVKLVVSGTTATLYGDGVSRVSGSVAGIPSSNYSGFGCNSAYSRVKKFEVY